MFHPSCLFLACFFALVLSIKLAGATTHRPTGLPTSKPSALPTGNPTGQPSAQPAAQPEYEAGLVPVCLSVGNQPATCWMGRAMPE